MPLDQLNVTALVVDDDDAIRRLISRILIREGVKVEPARDGVEAIEKIAERRFDIILLDLMMPRMNGFEVLGHLKKHHPELLRTVVVLTAVADNVLSALDADVFQTIRKPFDIQLLIGAVERCVRSPNP